MFEVLNQVPSTTHSEVFAVQNQKNPANDTIMTVLKTLTAEIAALRLDNASLNREFNKHRSRSRNRSPDSVTSDSDNKSYRSRQRSKRRYRSRSFRLPQPQPLYNGLCWYHHTYGDNARKCANDQCTMKNRISEN